MPVAMNTADDNEQASRVERSSIYDTVVKATEDSQVNTDWELILNLRDKIYDEGSSTAQKAITIALDRLLESTKKPAVQLHTLTLLYTLAANCGIELHRELVSTMFIKSLEKIITEVTSDEKVRQSALQLVERCAYDFGDNPELTSMDDFYFDLWAKNYDFENLHDFKKPHDLTSLPYITPLGDPYRDAVVEATNESLTSVDRRQLIMDLCEQVQEKGVFAARRVVAAVLGCLRSQTEAVRLNTLSLAETLVKNCGASVHRQVASRPFTECLEKFVTDVNTNGDFRRRALELIGICVLAFETDPALDLMEECYNGLKAKGYLDVSFGGPSGSSTRPIPGAKLQDDILTETTDGLPPLAKRRPREQSTIPPDVVSISGAPDRTFVIYYPPADEEDAGGCSCIIA